MTKRNALRLIVALAVVIMILGAAVPAGVADHGGPKHIVCTHVYYEYPIGSQPQDVVNECRVATTWGPAVDESGCRSEEGSIQIKVCHWVQVSSP